ncbi:undecaprenyl-diphosphatase [Aneurinibacillus soli]|uniref:Undecaprenyl-diphosphatase BcrC n=1 Tax=Aneurinibacillus soli TaxID=1500254 RepID=A0A0U5B8P5_9BACL|nr:phosphatase PAP2 family protein [Aneurinibacillus soli]PYE63993.1 undecaprenyl-diphosphatase [Aneurinibacillus soli]BAU27942.1 Undecaprenyl-diphosphatase BcrC [Aneurinibacillus soli]
MDALLSFDRWLFYWLNTQLYSPVLDPLMILATRISDKGIFWFIVAFVLLWQRRRLGLRPGVTLLVGIGIGGVLENIFKPLISRPRPPLVEDTVRQLVELPISHSFPSGHAVSSFVSMYVLYRLFPRTLWWALPCALIMSYSRIYVGVHYPLDVVAGALIGIMAGMITMRLPIRKLAYRIVPHIPIVRRFIILPTPDNIPSVPLRHPKVVQREEEKRTN